MAADTGSLGPLVRLWGISASRLPMPTATGDELAPFLHSILQEAVPFIDSAAPKSGAPADRKVWKAKGTKSSPQSAAKIEVSERVVGAKELEAAAGQAAWAKPPKAASEAWAHRRSVHADAAQTGTASWDEFVRCFRDEHAAAEEAFTPAVVATHEAQAWDCSGIEADVGGVHWGRFTLRLEEMRHQVGRPLLKDRTFPVLQMTASAAAEDDAAAAAPEFVVVSIPVPDFGKTDTSKLASEKGAQVAVYVSVERIRKLPGDAGEIEWLMATAGNAGGILPKWVQKMTMPGIVWKDVPLFLAWIAKERAKEGGAEREAAAEPVAAADADAEAAAPAADATAAPADADDAAAAADHEEDKEKEQLPPAAKAAADDSEAPAEASAEAPVAAENPPTLPAMGETDANWGASAFDGPLDTEAAKTSEAPVAAPAAPAAPAAESK